MPGMFRAIAQGKLRLPNADSEDCLTAAIFSRLSYLPSAVIMRTLSEANVGRSPLPQDPGGLLEVQFWPTWSCSHISANSGSVQPDVLFRFERLDMIVEAKRWDDRTQSAEQLAREWNAFEKASGLDHRPNKAVVLSIGGVDYDPNMHCVRRRKLASSFVEKLSSETRRKVALAFVSWLSFRRAVENLLESASPPANSFLLRDILEILERFGVRMAARVPFCELPERARGLTIDPDSSAVLEAWHERLRGAT